ncbi:MAG: hypothetical protein Q7R31_01845 [Candidatus Levybacteria bacterium]|nr:hypothetical protein [Candidatus Levybacteria bacterium]
MRKTALLFFAFFLFLTFHFSSLISPTFAQTKASPSANVEENVPNNLHNWTQTVMIEVMSALTCQLAGVDPINSKQSCLGIDQASGKIGFLPSPQTGGAIGFMGNMIATLYTPPLHTGDYFRDLASNFGINKKAYAESAGTGFQGLTPLIGIWSAFRNIVYLFLVIVFVVIGLAIMLRVKIDPRTVMTIQNQIPKIIIGILVVTFSFAIAGFLIDLMWVSIYLIFGIFSGIPGVDVGNLNPAAIQGQNALQAVGFDVFKITSDASGGIKDMIGSFLGIQAGPGFIFNPLAIIWDIGDPKRTGNIINWLIDGISSSAGIAAFLNVAKIPIVNSAIPGIQEIFGIGQTAAKTAVGSAFSLSVFSGTEFLLRTGLPWILAFLIIFIALLTALFRLWLALIMAYVHILIDVVLAPFWIIGGIVPGSPISLSGWIRDLVANLAAFPAVIGMFMLGKVFMEAFGKCPATNPNCTADNFVPPLIGNPGDPSLIGSLIGLGIILMTPNVVNMLKAALKAPKIDTGGIGKAFMPGLAVPGRTVGGIAGLALGTAYEKGALEKGLPAGERAPLGKFLRSFGFMR